MSRIATASGRVVDFLNPDPAAIRLGDISLALSRHPRYSGQTRRLYSVAQHSLLVAALVPPVYRLHALLHDAPEAYICDVPSPLKHAMRTIANIKGHQSPYDVIERGLWKAICRRYGVDEELPAEVARADVFAMVVEAPILQPEGWRCEVWDFAREDERLVAGIERERLLRILALPRGGGTEWLLEVVEELQVVIPGLDDVGAELAGYSGDGWPVAYVPGGGARGLGGV